MVASTKAIKHTNAKSKVASAKTMKQVKVAPTMAMKQTKAVKVASTKAMKSMKQTMAVKVVSTKEMKQTLARLQQAFEQQKPDKATWYELGPKKWMKVGPFATQIVIQH